MAGSTSVEEVAEALRVKLEQSGALRRLRASLRADVALALEPGVAHPVDAEPADETLLANELLREYMHFNHLTSTLSVFLAETGSTGTAALDRKELAQLCGVVDSDASRKLPLLYTLVERKRVS